MAMPQIPEGFDVNDPDMYAVGLPYPQFDELRRAAPVWWQAQPRHRDGFDDDGHWVVTRHADVKEISRNDAVFSTYENTAIIRFNEQTTRDQIEMQRVILLNMDAPQHTRMRAIISRGFTPRAVNNLREALERPGPQDRDRGPGHRRRRLRPRRGLRAAAAGDRRTAGRAPGGPRQTVRLVEPDGVLRRPRLRPERRRGRVVRDAQLLHGRGRGAQGLPDGRHRHQAGDGRHRRQRAHLRRVRLLHHPARRWPATRPPATRSATGCWPSWTTPTSGSCTSANVRRPRPTRSCGGRRRSSRSSARPSRTSWSATSRSRPASGSGCTTRPRISTTRSSPIRTASTSPAIPTRTWVSAAPARTTASARTWPGSRST